MKIRKLIEILSTFDPEKDAFVCDASHGELKVVELHAHVRANNGHAQLTTVDADANMKAVDAREASDAPEIKRMTAAEFREQGFLRELNRQLLHPMGLALEVATAEDGSEYFGGVWDYRSEPEGMAFEDAMVESDVAVAQAKVIELLRQSKEGPRKDLFGWTIQPVGKKEE